MMVSFCALQIEIADESNTLADLDFNCGRSLEYLLENLEMSSQPPKPVRSQSLRDRGNRQMSDIVVETYTDFNNGSNVERSKSSSSKEASPSTASSSASSSKRSTKDSTPNETEGASAASATSQQQPEVISFMSGNPFVEVTKGILHLYKENSTTSLEEGVLRSQMICMVGVPAKHKTPDLLQFTAPCHSELEMMRVIQYMEVPNQYMVLMRFRCQAAADEFYQAFNGVPYNSFESEVCSLVYISKVETCKESEYYPLSNHTELPVCSICLERMDESISTVLTILCNHTFHSSCLAQWEDTSCPVCRYVQTPELVAEQRCSECQSSDDLWICLVCGYVGCGRYVGGHSHAHFLQTEHSYTMELGQNRVWDYVGDNFVHRLVQTDSADGKLVEAEGRRTDCCGVSVNTDEKMDSIQLEYTYLLTSQLESQRRYFEEKISRVEINAQREMEEVMNRARTSVEETKALEAKLLGVTKEKAKGDQKLSSLTLKVGKLSTDLNEEKQINDSLRQNQTAWQAKFSDVQKQMDELKRTKDSEIEDLKEQIRDIMFYMEAQQKVADSPLKQEIQEGDIVVGASGTSPTTHNSTNSGRGGRKKRGR